MCQFRGQKPRSRDEKENGKKRGGTCREDGHCTLAFIGEESARKEMERLAGKAEEWEQKKDEEKIHLFVCFY